MSNNKTEQLGKSKELQALQSKYLSKEDQRNLLIQLLVYLIDKIDDIDQKTGADNTA